MTTATIENETSIVPTIVNIGDVVISTLGEYVYGGNHEEAGFTSISFDLRYGGSTLKTSSELVAPASLPINLKDSRISVEKDKENRPVSWVGQWKSSAVGVDYVAWEKTKRDGTLKMATLLAIQDWHANGGVVNA